MSIHHLFAKSPFGPDEIANLVAAYEDALRTLGLAQRDDALTALVAKKIIAIAQRGVRDAGHMAERAVDELRFPERSQFGTDHLAQG